MTTRYRLLRALALAAAISLHGAVNYDISGVVVDSQSQKTARQRARFVGADHRPSS